MADDYTRHERRTHEYLGCILHELRRLITMSGNLQSSIDALTAQVTAEDTVIDGAVTLINGFAAQLAAAVAAAQAAGASPAQLQALTDLGTTIQGKSTALAAAVTANTPVASA